jgi:hypothetical protein
VRRDELPARLWGWPSQTVHLVREDRDVLRYPDVPREVVASRQAALSRALTSLHRKGLVAIDAEGRVSLTDAGYRVNFDPVRG